jgi:5-methylcytosine-specific restriction endonuclease McrA
MSIPRRTPLKRSTTPLKRTGRPKPRSKKRAELYRTQRAPLVARLLADHPPCQRCMSRAATDVHEIKTRARGGSLTDLENLALLCRPCHTWVTDNPAEARAQGWVLNSWD